jgi:carbamoyltransferase
MPSYHLSFKPAIDMYGGHDPSAAIFEDGALQFAAEEERYTRRKHASGQFPESAIRACLDYCDIELPDVSKVVLPYDPQLRNRNFWNELERRVTADKSIPEKLRWIERHVEGGIQAQFYPKHNVRQALRTIGEPLPEITLRAHHRCHAASAFHPSGFDRALCLTIDGNGEYDSTVVWRCDEDGMERLRTYAQTNSLGHFYGVVTEYLGYRAFNGEGKVMGLAPYGEVDQEILDALRTELTFGRDYDVSYLTQGGVPDNVGRLERLLGRPRNEREGEFDEWQQDLARTVQHVLEETVLEILTDHIETTGLHDVCLAGGVALNCKMNKRIREAPAVREVFVQPVAHDGGLALGAGYLEQAPSDVPRMEDVYLGDGYDPEAIRSMLDSNKIGYEEPNDVPAVVAERIADGDIVGWFEGRTELGPRALGNRSILADPRSEASRDRVNRYVKHREEWRPFAPSILESAADEYLVDGEAAPFMIDTFDVQPERREELEAVLHPADDTTRPQTVRPDQNPRYHRLISAFEDLTGVPAILNTSFNDHGEPIVNRPVEALKDFNAMGIDVLVLDEFLVEK